MDHAANLPHARGVDALDTTCYSSEPGIRDNGPPSETGSHNTPSYAAMLAVLGTWLDQATSYHIALQERGAGFTLRCQRRKSCHLASVALYLSFAQLHSWEEVLTRREARSRHTPLSLGSKQRSYQTLLQTLGAALDRVSAQHMALHELGNGSMVVTYQVPESAERDRWSERTALVTPDQVPRDARAQRKPWQQARRHETPTAAGLTLPH